MDLMLYLRNKAMTILSCAPGNHQCLPLCHQTLAASAEKMTGLVQDRPPRSVSLWLWEDAEGAACWQEHQIRNVLMCIPVSISGSGRGHPHQLHVVLTEAEQHVSCSADVP